MHAAGGRRGGNQVEDAPSGHDAVLFLERDRGFGRLDESMKNYQISVDGRSSHDASARHGRRL